MNASATHSAAGGVPARSSDPIDSRDAQRERLLLLCAVDRARLRLLLRVPTRPKPEAPSSFASGLFSAPMLTELLPWMPGPIGRWSRRLRTGARLAGLFRTMVRGAT